MFDWTLLSWLFYSLRFLLFSGLLFCFIISRAKYKMRLLDDAYSRDDTYRKHIRKRFQYLTHLDWKNGDRLKCYKCNETIELNSPFFIHRRRSYNRFFHASCASILNLIYLIKQSFSRKYEICIFLFRDFIWLFLLIS